MVVRLKMSFGQGQTETEIEPCSLVWRGLLSKHIADERGTIILKQRHAEHFSAIKTIVCVFNDKMKNKNQSTKGSRNNFHLHDNK